jgi:hypothetical protein
VEYKGRGALMRSCGGGVRRAIQAAADGEPKPRLSSCNRLISGVAKSIWGLVGRVDQRGIRIGLCLLGRGNDGLVGCCGRVEIVLCSIDRCLLLGRYCTVN